MTEGFPPTAAKPGSPIARATALTDCIGLLLRALAEPNYDDEAANHAGMVSVKETRASVHKMYARLGKELRGL